MKRIVPLFFLLVLLCGCARTPLETVLSEALATEESLPAGKTQVYGRMYKKSMSRDFLTDYFGCEGYPEFPDKIEEMALYTSLVGDYAEVCVLRVYDAADRYDAALFLERRIASARYALTVLGKKGYADTAFVEARGNTVALFMLPDNETVRKKVF